MADIAADAAALGEWFHNIDLGGVQTAPSHPLGDYPAIAWQYFADSLPQDMTGKSVLDIGCNGGFFAIEMKRRGAERVLGVDADERYLAQARYAAGVLRLDIEYRALSVYDVAALAERFDVVFFMGVLYHLRHPLLALDLIREHVVGDLLVFQTLQRGAGEVSTIEPDYPFRSDAPFVQAQWPRLHFIEERFAGDPTNWWIPNRACTEAMLRNAGFRIIANPDRGVYFCQPCALPFGAGAVYPNGGART